MTGFGSASDTDFAVQIRSVNHRFFDISIKMPPSLQEHEIPLRNILKEQFSRGRFDVVVSVGSEKALRMTWNSAQAKSLFAALQDLQKELSLPGRITIQTFTEFRDILFEPQPTFDARALYGVFREAVRELRNMRVREGALLEAEIRSRVETLRTTVDRLKREAPDELDKWRRKFSSRLEAIVGEAGVDHNRILQEAALLAEKMDISEEISRLEHHLKQMGEVLDEDGAIGKKLDFLVQEMNREVNTLACKSADYTISTLVIDMKTELEKIREQVQNIQ